MFLTIEEIVLWLRLSIFEIWIHLISITIFSILLPLKLDNYLDEYNWFIIFIPLYVCDILNAYFNVILVIRLYLENSFKVAFVRAFSSSAYFILPIFFKILLCKKLEGEPLEYSEVFAALFVLLQLMAIKACQLNNQ
ncbi:transmembrane protein 203 [Chrysoperla carnea]|uniref:transmembrane protein 203 n=1 Tax=Chrysoperla carnea TaxID=189513 RepID=UPI001D078214|nr:transmembrane protein 203 [Chrysoperla carnea]